jgi:hypothetical protein
MNHVRIAQYLASVRVRVVTTFCLRLRALVTCNLTLRMMPVASGPLLFPSERSDTCTVVRRLRSEDDVWCGSVVLPKPGHVMNAPSRGRDAKALTHLVSFLTLPRSHDLFLSNPSSLHTTAPWFRITRICQDHYHEATLLSLAVRRRFDHPDLLTTTTRIPQPPICKFTQNHHSPTTPCNEETMNMLFWRPLIQGALFTAPQCM